MTHVVYRFSCERDERLARNVSTYQQVKERIAEDCKLRSDRTRLVLKFDDEHNESTPIDENQVEKNRRLIVQRLPVVTDESVLTSSEASARQSRDRFLSAKVARIKTTGQPIRSLRSDNASLETCRKQQGYDIVVRWEQIRTALSKYRPVRHQSPDSYALSPADEANVLDFLRRIRRNLDRSPALALEYFFRFRSTCKGTVYCARYCGRQSEYLLALERIYYGLFERDFKNVSLP